MCFFVFLLKNENQYEFSLNFYVSRRGRKEREESSSDELRTPTTHLLLRSNEPMKFAKAPRCLYDEIHASVTTLRSSFQFAKQEERFVLASESQTRLNFYSECNRSSTIKLLTRIFTQEELSVLCVFARDKEAARRPAQAKRVR